MFLSPMVSEQPGLDSQGYIYKVALSVTVP